MRNWQVVCGVALLVLASACDGAGDGDVGQDAGGGLHECDYGSISDSVAVLSTFLASEFPQTGADDDDGVYIAPYPLSGYTINGPEWDAIGIGSEGEECYDEIRQDTEALPSFILDAATDIDFVANSDVADVANRSKFPSELDDRGWGTLLAIAAPVWFPEASAMIFEAQTLPASTTSLSTSYTYTRDTNGAWRLAIFSGFCCTQFEEGQANAQ